MKTTCGVVATVGKAGREIASTLHTTTFAITLLHDWRRRLVKWRKSDMVLVGSCTQWVYSGNLC